MFVMIHVDKQGLDGLHFAQQLLEQKGVSVLPGVGFGPCVADYVRVSLAQPINILRPAFDRIEQFCEQELTASHKRSQGELS